MSNTASITVVKKGSPPPIIYMNMPTGKVFTRDTLIIEASASFSKCVSSKAMMDFLWTVSESESFAPEYIVPGLNATTAKLMITPGVLQPGTTYYVRLTASLPDSGEVSQTRALTVDRSPLVARISGGNLRLAYFGDVVEFDASESFDPDFCPAAAPGEQQEPCKDHALAYEWSCVVPSTRTLCRRSADKALLSLGSNAAALVDFSQLERTLARVVITVTVSKGTRSTSSSVKVDISDQPVLPVSMSVVKHTPERILVSADDTSSTCTWSISGGNIPADVDYESAPYNDRMFVSTAWRASTLSVRMQSAVGMQVLPVAATYTITLSCASADGVRGRASFSWYLRAAPWCVYVCASVYVYMFLACVAVAVFIHTYINTYTQGWCMPQISARRHRAEQ
jgi:hypothetical protein